MRKNYITIQGWMITDLDLSGNQLLTYALIYGFTQDSETEFSGSIKYICKWLNCSKPTAIKSINDLEQKGLIIKSQISINGVYFNRYKVVDLGSKESLPPVKKIDLSSKESLSGVVKNLYGGGKESLPIYNIDNNINNINNNNIHPLQKFIFENLPNVSKLKKQLTFEDCEKILSLVKNKEIIKDVLLAMENKSDLSKKYLSVNLTLRNWLKLRGENLSIKPKENQNPIYKDLK